MIETTLRNILIADNKIKSLVSGRVYLGALPQNPVLPAISFFRVSNYRPHNLNTASPRFQFDCWVTSYSVAVELGDEIRKALHGKQGIFTGIQVVQGTYLSDDILYEPDTKIFHLALDAKIIYRD